MTPQPEARCGECDTPLVGNRFDKPRYCPFGHAPAPAEQPEVECKNPDCDDPVREGNICDKCGWPDFPASTGAAERIRLLDFEGAAPTLDSAEIPAADAEGERTDIEADAMRLASAWFNQWEAQQPIIDAVQSANAEQAATIAKLEAALDEAAANIIALAPDSERKTRVLRKLGEVRAAALAPKEAAGATD